MITVNLFDSAFAHIPNCSVPNKTPRHIRFVRDRTEWDGVTIFTDDHLLVPAALDKVTSRWKVGWLLEPRAYKPRNYLAAQACLPKLDLLLTHDKAFIAAQRSDKVRWVPFGGCWIPNEQWGEHPKNEPGACQIISAKMFMPGHGLRHEIARQFPRYTLGRKWVRQVDSFGAGVSGARISNEERGRILGLYSFAVVVENSRVPGFFTEKLLDCFALGTVPIYWGCPNVSDYFDPRGMIQFEHIDELPAILASLNYESHRPGIMQNFARFQEFAIAEDWFAMNVLPELANGT